MARIEEFERLLFSHEGVGRPVFRRGAGPSVIVLHELPGMTPEVLELACRVAAAGFTTYLPNLFGEPGQAFSPGYLVKQLASVCIQREFLVLARKESSPVCDWLRALCRWVDGNSAGTGVGAIGMCLTGGFVLSMMVDASLQAPVLSQPSLPFPISSSHRAALGISDADLHLVRCRARQGCEVLGLRFSADRLCPAARFATLRRELGSAFEAIEIDSGRGNPHGVSRLAHRVLTGDFVDQEGHPTRLALDRVIDFLRARLGGL